MATLAALIPGLALGLLVVAGSSRWQFVMSRVVDLGVALPGILVALVLATAIGPGNVAAMAAIAVWFVPILARLMIGPARQILAYDYVEAAYAYGRSRWFVLMRHVLPNIRSLIIVQVTIMFSLAINVEAALSYLGVGAQRPTPSWGRMLYEGQPFIQDAPHLMIYPGLAITLTVLAYNLVGDGMRTWFDPQQKAKAVAR
ncbi:ABC transporter permease [Qaidamihabitans albus]|uniref:ABC transporter permease n=1 Tax=Qaidamihabitans albus TaxID=2795733 RepID=UPI0018F24353|nr:ABC transporter permease [Qaidamihabitans albus]